MSEPGGSRAELLDAITKYLDALAARELAHAPLSGNVRYTENGQEIPLGSGVWASQGGEVTYRLLFADAVQGQVGAFAVVPENGFPGVMSLRLKVVEGLITEAEAIVARTGAAIFQPEALTEPSGPMAQPVPPSERSSRDELVAAAESYWNAIEECGREGGLTFRPSIDPECLRVENGHTTTGHMTLAELIATGNAALAEGFLAVRRLRIVDQLEGGCFGYIKQVRDRRYPIIDEEQGLVFSIALFNAPGSTRGFELPGLGWFDLLPTAQLPVSPLIGELFKISGGQIRAIEAVLNWFPYGIKSGWS